MKTLYWILYGGSLFVLLAAVGYSWRNLSGHTGGNPMEFSLLFAPVLLLGIVGLVVTGGKWRSARAVVAVGLAGLAYGVFVTRFGILNEYGDWIGAGMPDRNPAAPVLLIGFAILAVGGSFAAAFLGPSKRRVAA